MDLLPEKFCLGGLSVDRLSQLDLAWPIFLRGLAIAIGKLDNPHFVGAASEFNRASGFQFLHQIGSMGLDGFHANIKLLGNLLGTESLGHRLEHLAFSIG